MIELFATNAYSNKIYAKWRNLCQNYNPTKKKKKTVQKCFKEKKTTLRFPKQVIICMKFIYQLELLRTNCLHIFSSIQYILIFSISISPENVRKPKVF